MAMRLVETMTSNKLGTGFLFLCASKALKIELYSSHDPSVVTILYNKTVRSVHFNLVTSL